jgi:hypothetical protein
MDILGDWTGLFASKPAPTSAPRSKVGAGLLAMRPVNSPQNIINIFLNKNETGFRGIQQ